MKTLLMILMMTIGVAAQEAPSCTTLYTNSNITLCHLGHTYTQTFNNGSSVSESTITETTYRKWMSEDTAALQAHLAQLKAAQEQSKADRADFEAQHAKVMAAMKITNKKDCTASGFAWSHGACTVKETK